jgi:hypothetical protein
LVENNPAEIEDFDKFFENESVFTQGMPSKIFFIEDCLKASDYEDEYGHVFIDHSNLVDKWKKFMNMAINLCN